MHYLTFEVGGHRLAVPVELVREVVRAVALARLPGAPEIVNGAINVRGSLVPVIALARRFGFPEAALHPDHHLVIARAGPRLVALHVERALELVRVEPQDVVPVSAVAPGTEHVAGLARLPDGVLVIQDLERFLSLDEGARLEAALASEAGRR